MMTLVLMPAAAGRGEEEQIGKTKKLRQIDPSMHHQHRRNSRGDVFGRGSAERGASSKGVNEIDVRTARYGEFPWRWLSLFYFFFDVRIN